MMLFSVCRKRVLNKCIMYRDDLQNQSKRPRRLYSTFEGILKDNPIEATSALKNIFCIPWESQESLRLRHIDCQQVDFWKWLLYRTICCNNTIVCPYTGCSSSIPLPSNGLSYWLLIIDTREGEAILSWLFTKQWLVKLITYHWYYRVVRISNLIMTICDKGPWQGPRPPCWLYQVAPSWGDKTTPHRLKA